MEIPPYALSIFTFIFKYVSCKLFYLVNRSSKLFFEDFPGGAAVKNLPANAGDMDSSPGLGRSHLLRSN